MTDTDSSLISETTVIERHSKPVLRICAEASVREAGRTILRFFYERIVANEEGTIEGSDPESLHDMRVAVRRLRVALRILRKVFGRERLETFMEDSRWIGRLLGDVRDIDVSLEWLHEYREKTSDFQRPFVCRIIQLVEDDRSAHRQGMLEGLSSERYEQFKYSFAAFLEADESFHIGANGDDSVVSFAVSAVQQQWKRVQKAGKRIDIDNPDSDCLHRLRIDCKRMRYTSEFYRDLFQDRLSDLIDDLTGIQDAIGGMRDAHQLSLILRRLTAGHFKELHARMALLQVFRALKRRQRKEYREFCKLWSEFSSKEFRRKVKRVLTKTTVIECGEAKEGA